MDQEHRLIHDQSSRNETPTGAWVGFGLGAVALLAALMLVFAESPFHGVAAIGGLVFLWVGRKNLAAAVALYTVLTFFDRLPGAVKTNLTVTKLGGAALVLLWLVAIRTGRPRVTPVFSLHPLLSWTVVALALYSVVSAFWAPSFGLAVSTATRLVQGLVLMLVAWSAVRTRQHIWWILTAFIVGAVLTSVLSGSPTAGAGDRLAGDFGDPNELASVIVPALVFASVAVLLRRGWIRFAALLCIPLLLRALLRTDSRGGLVALGVALVFAALLAGPVRRRVVPIVACFLAAGLAWTLVIHPSTRLQSAAEDAGSGRLDLWNVAVHVIGDHPVFGVGAGNFPEIESEYAIGNLSLARVDLVVTKTEVVHNTYLELLAELGIVGFLCYLAVVLGALNVARHGILAAARRRAFEVEMLARALVVSIVAVLVAQIFLTFQYEKQLWLLLGVAAATYTVARRSHEAGIRATDGSSRPWSRPLESGRAAG